jgi:hypothetical protein
MKQRRNIFVASKHCGYDPVDLSRFGDFYGYCFFQGKTEKVIKSQSANEEM